MELRPYQQQAKDAIFSEWEMALKKLCLCCQLDAERPLFLRKLRKNVLREEAVS